MAKEGTTRYYSNRQEKAVATLLEGFTNPSSGSSKFNKSDVMVPQASLLIECKTTMTDKKSFSVKEEWLEKNKEEGFSQRLTNTALAFNFGPDKPNYFVIDEKLMKVLTEALVKYNS